MMKRFLLFPLATLLVLAACGSNANEESSGETDAERALLPLVVEILTEEDAFQPGEEGKFEVLVTEGEEKVTDADEVLFEIGKPGEEDEAEKIDGSHDGDGQYSLAYTFEEEGIYYMIPHVTARGKHTMPKKQFNVGNVDEADYVDADAEADHYDTEDFSIHLMKPDMIETDAETEWIVHIEKDGLPFTDADVRLEFWKQDVVQHDFVPTEETNAGEYIANWEFSEPGEHYIQIHVEKEELHEHIERTFQVE